MKMKRVKMKTMMIEGGYPASCGEFGALRAKAAAVEEDDITHLHPQRERPHRRPVRAQHSILSNKKTMMMSFMKMMMKMRMKDRGMYPLAFGLLDEEVDAAPDLGAGPLVEEPLLGLVARGGQLRRGMEVEPDVVEEGRLQVGQRDGDAAGKDVLLPAGGEVELDLELGLASAAPQVQEVLLGL